MSKVTEQCAYRILWPVNQKAFIGVDAKPSRKDCSDVGIEGWERKVVEKVGVYAGLILDRKQFNVI